MEFLLLAGAAAAGFAVRSGLFFPDLPKAVSERVEFSVPTNSWRRVSEGEFLYHAGVDPYSGDMFHETPLCLLLFTTLRKICPTSFDLLFPLCDLLTACLLYFFAKKLVEDTIISEQKAKNGYAKGTSSLLVAFEDIVTVPRLVFLWYLFNPYVIGSCLEKTTSVFTNFLLAAMLFSASQGPSVASRFFSLLFLALATYQTLYMFLLFPALHLYFLHVLPEEKRNYRVVVAAARLVIHLAIFVTILAALIVGSSCIMGSWSFVRGVYGFAVFAPDLTPNIGLFWYFFTEMFEQFRTFFTWIFFINVCIYSVPVSIKLRHDPPFAIFALLSLITIFKPYPSYGDVGFYLSLFPIWKRLYTHMRQSLVVTVMLLVAAVLFPVLWKLWIEVGSANANFFYAITLVFVASQVFFVTDIMLAHEKREWHLKNGMLSDLNQQDSKMDLHLE